MILGIPMVVFVDQLQIARDLVIFISTGLHNTRPKINVMLALKIRLSCADIMLIIWFARVRNVITFESSPVQRTNKIYCNNKNHLHSYSENIR